MFGTDSSFAGSIPKLYDEYLVPLFFEPYATDLVNRLRSRFAKRSSEEKLSHVLEIAAGTGVVTRALAAELSENVSIVATDLNQAMIDQAIAVGTKRPVAWHQADALNLPFRDEEFDAVVCQFGVMFFPDKSQAFSEVRRVLKPGGIFIFNVWDKIAENEFTDTVTRALTSMFPEDPPGFMTRTPHGYYDQVAIEQDLRSGGFKESAQMVTVTRYSRAQSPRMLAIALCQGTPLRNEIEARDAARLGEATDVAANAIAEQFGLQVVEGKIQAHIISIKK